MATEKKNFIGHLADWITWQRFIFAIVLFFFLTSIIFPFYWMISSSFKTRAEIGGREPVYIPSELRLDAYRELFDPNYPGYQNFGKNIVNTLKVSVPTAIIAVVLPLFAMLAQLGSRMGFNVQDNLTVLVFTYLAQTLPVALYMLTNYFRTIPDEIEQAALIDGCSRLEVIWRVTIPLAIPALVSVSIYTFMIAWNEFLYALVFLNDRNMFTMPIKINAIYNDPSPKPNVVMAASTIMTIPIVILFLAMERYLEEGLTAGGVKG